MIKYQKQKSLKEIHCRPCPLKEKFRISSEIFSEEFLIKKRNLKECEEEPLQFDDKLIFEHNNKDSFSAVNNICPQSNLSSLLTKSNFEVSNSLISEKIHSPCLEESHIKETENNESFLTEIETKETKNLQSKENEKDGMLQLSEYNFKNFQLVENLEQEMLKLKEQKQELLMRILNQKSKENEDNLKITLLVQNEELLKRQNSLLNKLFSDTLSEQQRRFSEAKVLVQMSETSITEYEEQVNEFSERLQLIEGKMKGFDHQILNIGEKIFKVQSEV